MKDNKIFPQFLYKLINESLKTGTSLDPLELAEITPIHKKEDPFDKENHCPISILPLISKVFDIKSLCLPHGLDIAKFKTYGFDSIS